MVEGFLFYFILRMMTDENNEAAGQWEGEISVHGQGKEMHKAIRKKMFLVE